jgi:hypothetical protein
MILLNEQAQRIAHMCHQGIPFIVHILLTRAGNWFQCFRK